MPHGKKDKKQRSKVSSSSDDDSSDTERAPQKMSGHDHGERDRAPQKRFEDSGGSNRAPQRRFDDSSDSDRAAQAQKRFQYSSDYGRMPQSLQEKYSSLSPMQLKEHDKKKSQQRAKELRHTLFKDKGEKGEKRPRSTDDEVKARPAKVARCEKQDHPEGPVPLIGHQPDEEPTTEQLYAAWMNYVAARAKEEGKSTLEAEKELDDRNDTLLEIVRENSERRLCLFGEMASGKSSIINKIIGRPLLPTSSGAKSCSCVACEVRYWDKNEVRIELSWLQESEWKAMRAHMALVLRMSIDPDSIGEESDDETMREAREKAALSMNDIDLVTYAGQVLSDVYGPNYQEHFDKLCSEKWEDEKIQEILLGQPKVYTYSHKDIKPARDCLEFLLSSGELPKGAGLELAYPHLLELVKLRVRFDHPSPQSLCIVDLPGNNDKFDHRKKITMDNLLQKCDVLWWVIKPDERVASSATDRAFASDIIRSAPKLFLECTLFFNKADQIANHEQLISESTETHRIWWESFSKYLQEDCQSLQYSPPNVLLLDNHGRGLDGIRKALWKADAPFKDQRKRVISCIEQRRNDPEALPETVLSPPLPTPQSEKKGEDFNTFLPARCNKLFEVLQKCKSTFKLVAKSFYKKLEELPHKSLMSFMVSEGNYTSDVRNAKILMARSFAEILLRKYDESVLQFWEVDVPRMMASEMAKIQSPNKRRQVARCFQKFADQRKGIPMGVEIAIKNEAKRNGVFEYYRGKGSAKKNLEHFKKLMDDKWELLFLAAMNVFKETINGGLKVLEFEIGNLQKANSVPSPYTELIASVLACGSEPDAKTKAVAETLFNHIVIALKRPAVIKRRVLLISQELPKNRKLIEKILANRVSPSTVCMLNASQMNGKNKLPRANEDTRTKTNEHTCPQCKGKNCLLNIVTQKDSIIMRLTCISCNHRWEE